MARHLFPAIFEPEDGLYNVSFPDIPNCLTCGDDLTDAVFMAVDALNGWLAWAEENGREIPSPSALSELRPPANATVSLIPADTEAYRRTAFVIRNS